MVKLISTDKSLEKGFELCLKSLTAVKFDGEITAQAGLNAGFTVAAAGGKATINYSSKNSFFNALGLLLATGKGCSKTKYTGGLSVMPDCARNAVPTVKFLKDYAVRLALTGYGAIGLYLEDLFEVEGEPFFGYKRGRYSRAELTELIEFADIFGVEIVPYIQTLAHLNAIFKWHEYVKINDYADILLVEDGRTTQLIDNMLKTVSNTFKTDRVHIGMDEAHMLGLGKYLDRNGVKDRHAIMRGHIELVLGICKKYNLKAEMWSDMFFRLAFSDAYYATDKQFEEGFGEKYVPADVKLIYWDYYHSDFDSYDKMFNLHKQISDNIGFAGGAWTWAGVTPFNQYSIQTSTPAIKACKKHGIGEITITQWHDSQGECSYLAVAAAMLNNFSLVLDKELSKSDLGRLAKCVYGYSFDELMKLDLPNTVKDMSVDGCSYYLMWNDPLLNLNSHGIKRGYAQKYAMISAQLKGLARRNTELSYLFNTMHRLSSALEVSCEMGMDIKQAYLEKNLQKLKEIAVKDIKTLIIRIESYLNATKTQWLKEKKSFGFDAISIRTGGMIYRLKYIAETLLKYAGGELDKIEELEQEDLPLYGNWENDADKNLLRTSGWVRGFTNSRLGF